MLGLGRETREKQDNLRLSPRTYGQVPQIQSGGKSKLIHEQRTIRALKWKLSPQSREFHPLGKLGFLTSGMLRFLVTKASVEEVAP